MTFSEKDCNDCTTVVYEYINGMTKVAVHFYPIGGGKDCLSECSFSKRCGAPLQKIGRKFHVTHYVAYKESIAMQNRMHDDYIGYGHSPIELPTYPKYYHNSLWDFYIAIGYNYKTKELDGVKTKIVKFNHN